MTFREYITEGALKDTRDREIANMYKDKTPYPTELKLDLGTLKNIKVVGKHYFTADLNGTEIGVILTNGKLKEIFNTDKKELKVRPQLKISKKDIKKIEDIMK